MLIFSLMLLGWTLGNLLWWRHAHTKLKRSNRPAVLRGLLGLFVSIQLLFLVLTFIGSLAELPIEKGIVWPTAAYIWHLAVLPLTLFCIGVAWCIRKLRPKQQGPTSLSAEPGHRFSRRQVLGAISVALPPLSTLALTGRSVIQLNQFRIRREVLRIPTLPADLDGVTIAHVTDLHIGQYLPTGMAERVADATNALEADLIAFTGDLLDISAPKVQPGIDFIRRLQPRHGLVMIEGNHDGMTDAGRFENMVRDAGLPLLLLDEAATLRIPGRSSPIQFLGVSWGELTLGRNLGRTGKEASRFYRAHSDQASAASLQKVIGLRDPTAFPILLAHHPHLFDAAAAAGLPLTLSGHTHGGQIMLTDHLGAGPARFRYWTGEYAKAQSRLFIANGVGNWFPVRFNAPAEIVHLTLRRG